MAYEVKLDVFEGPIDLLLHLITRQRVDIYAVSLSSITEEYLAAVARIETFDLDLATGFLVVASTLLELKSLRLLPSRTSDDASGLLEERDLLLARLVECATFRSAGAWIAAGLREGEALHGRAVTLEPQFVDLAPDLLAGTRPHAIAAAAARALAAPPPAEIDVTHIAPPQASVREAVIEVARLLQGRRAATFEELCGPGCGRSDVVVRFLALLELFKAGAIEIEQSERWGDIRAAWTGDASPEAIAQEAEEYAVGPGGAA